MVIISMERKHGKGMGNVIGRVLFSVAQSSPSLCDPMDCSPPGFFVRGDSPGKNTGVGWNFLLQDIFPAWDQTWVSCVGRFFTTEPPGKPYWERGKHNIVGGWESLLRVQTAVENGWSTATYHNIHESPKHHVEQEKQGNERRIL